MAPAKSPPPTAASDDERTDDPRRIVCACALLSARAIERAIDDGERTMSALATGCGASGGCGSCRGEVEKILRQKLIAPRESARATAQAEATRAQLGFSFDDDSSR